MDTSPIFGGNGGMHRIEEFNNVKKLCRIEARGGCLVDSLMFTWLLDDNEKVTGTYFGGNGGSGPSILELDDNEYITKINIRSGRLIDSLEFITSKGNSMAVGGTGGSLNQIIIPSGNKIVGFSISSGIYVDSFGVIWAPQ